MRQRRARPPAALRVLYEAPGLPAFDLPPALRALYGGSLGFVEPRLYANFVSSLDGVVALPGRAHSNRLIAGASEADRFVMALLRACADVVLVGAGTFNASPRAVWTPAEASPRLEAELGELRRRRGRPSRPELALVTAVGSIDVRHPALETGALVLTSAHAARRLRASLPASCTIVPVDGGETLPPRAVIDALRRRGHRLILAESGPRLFGALLAAGLVDEHFLTLSPLVAGRAAGERPGLVQGVELLPGRAVGGCLLGVRSAGDRLFLRYAMAAGAGRTKVTAPASAGGDTAGRRGGRDR